MSGPICEGCSKASRRRARHASGSRQRREHVAGVPAFVSALRGERRTASRLPRSRAHTGKARATAVRWSRVCCGRCSTASKAGWISSARYSAPSTMRLAGVDLLLSVDEDDREDASALEQLAAALRRASLLRDGRAADPRQESRDLVRARYVADAARSCSIARRSTCSLGRSSTTARWSSIASPAAAEIAPYKILYVPGARCRTIA